MTTMLTIDGSTLSLCDIVRVARPTDGLERCHITLSQAARVRLLRARNYVERHWLTADAEPIYGFNTGVGRLKDWRVPVDRMREFQRLLVNAHSAGVGLPFHEDVVRATMLLRINANARGNSGVRVDVVDRLIAMLQSGVHPIIPQKGSVGASGDLAPLAYLAAALMGLPNAEVTFRGTRMPATCALESIGLKATFDLEAKEALALLNGSTVSLAVATLAIQDAIICMFTADVALALTMEALRASQSPFDSRIHVARPHRGQMETARVVGRLLDGSERCCASAQAVVLQGTKNTPANQPRVQDAYSLRCAPQVHGPVRDALNYVAEILAVEINSSTDNPLMFPRESDPAKYDVISGGNFHGQYVAQAMDLLAMALTDLGSISERRASRLLDPSTSYGLPVNLVARDPGLNTGFSIAQCSMAALVVENRTLSSPASADSIPTKGTQEDHVSNSTWCSRKAAEVVSNVFDILSIELLMAAQAIGIVQTELGQRCMGRGTGAVYDLLRSVVPASLGEDRWIHDDLQKVAALVRSGTVLERVKVVLPDIFSKLR